MTKIKKKTLMFILLFLTTYQPSHLCFAAFQDMGWGARPLGMGGAFVAISDDVNASWWNPAGLDQLESREAGFMYAKPYMGLEGLDWGLLYLSYAHPVKQNRVGVFGINLTSFKTGSLYQESTFSFSYAWRMGRTLHGGANIKYLYHRYNWDEGMKALDDPVVNSGSSRGNLSIDLGALYRPGRTAWGLSLKNINQPDVGLYYKDLVPRELRAGVAHHIGDVRAMEDVVVAFDASYRNQAWAKENRITLFLGAESWFRFHTIGLRAGMNLSGLRPNE